MQRAWVVYSHKSARPPVYRLPVRALVRKDTNRRVNKINYSFLAVIASPHFIRRTARELFTLSFLSHFTIQAHSDLDDQQDVDLSPNGTCDPFHQSPSHLSKRADAS